MSGFGSRVRVRIKPSVSLGNRVIGHYSFRGNTTDWKWKSLNDLQGDDRQFAYNSLNYVKKEYCQDELHLGPPYRSGGPFARTIVEVPAFAPQGNGSYISNEIFNSAFGYGQFRYEGGFISQSIVADDENDGKFQNDFNDYPSLIPDVTGEGPKAWRKTAPKIEIGGLAIALAEGRDLPGMLRSTAKTFHEVWKDMAPRNRKSRDNWSMQPRNVAKSYLNAQFGWVPFVSDIGKLIDVYHNSEKYVHRITVENGISVRKRKVLEKSTSQTNLWTSNNYNWVVPSFPYYQNQPGWFTRPPFASIIKHESVLTVGVGKFRYWRPEFDASDSGRYSSAISSVERNLALHGLRVNPSNLYRVMPWSWLIDWFSNVGDNVANFTSMYGDSMVAEYFYVMQHKRTKVVLTQVLPFNSGDVVVEFPRFIDVKQRNGDVSPFGLSLGTPTSAFQFSILAALGLSRKG